MLKSRSWVIAGVLLLCGLITGLIIATQLDLPSISTSAEILPPEPIFRIASLPLTKDTLAYTEAASRAFTRVARQVIPNVVSIASTKVYFTEDEGLGGNRSGRGLRFRAPQQFRQLGRGSGVILSADGYILTNVHVVANAQKIAVTLNDNRTFEAKIVGLDPLTEIAVVKIAARGLPAALLGNSDACTVGEWVLAVGNPLDLQSTVTAGIISAIGRQLDIIEDSYAVESFIQTDAAINPGNSGGALVNLRGEVIGINTAIATETGYDMGFGFAVPINLARRIASDLIRKGKVVRSYLGIALQNIDELQARALKLGKPRGVFVDDVYAGSPAQREGMRPMDVILEVDGVPMNRVNQLQTYVASKAPGTKLRVRCFREGREISKTITLAEKEVASQVEARRVHRRSFKDLGAAVEPLSEIDASELGYKGKPGVLVTRVERFSQADDAGMRIDDIITKVNDQTVHNPVEYSRIVRSIPPGEIIIMAVFRSRGTHHLFVTTD